MHVFKTLLLFIATTLLGIFMGFSQNINRTNHWFFGDEYGLEFSRESFSLNNNSEIVASEATATISDTEGNLLFYTDGSKVWNRNHTVMENGTGLNGRRQFSQPVLIVPNPENDNLYYIFTIGSFYGDLREGPFNSPAVDYGLKYSIVDFSDNTNGRISEKNVHLLDHTALKMSAIEKCSDNSFWLTTLSTADGTKGGDYNTIYSFRVDGNGVNNSPIKSTTDKFIDDPRGSMKFSPDGSKLAAANMKGRLLLANFDIESGTISNDRKLSIKDLLTFAVAEWPYSVEFSLDSKVLYVGSITDPEINSEIKSGLVQFFIGDSETNSVSSNKTILEDNEPIFGSGLQLARNGKIYRAYTYHDGNLPTYLGVINSPELEGLESNYQHDAIELARGFSSPRRSLPHFVPSFFNIDNLVESTQESKEVSICETIDYSFTSDNIEGAEYIWYKDGNRLEGERDHILTLNNVSENDKGHYELIINPNDGTCSKHKEAFVIEIVELARMPDNLELKQCRSEVSNSAVFNLKEILNAFDFNEEETEFNFYESNPEIDSNSTPIHDDELENYITSAGGSNNIYVEAINKLGCSTFQTFKLTVVDASLPSIEDIELCDANDEDPHDNSAFFQPDFVTTLIKVNNNIEDDISFSYYRSYDDALREINKISDQALGNNTQVWIRGEKSGSDCLGISQFRLRVLQIPKVELNPINDVICVNPLTDEILNTVSLGRDLGVDYNYTWIKNELEEISNNPIIQVSETGNYRVLVSDNINGCSYFSNSVEISLSSIPINDPAWLTIEQSSPFSSVNDVSITARGVGDTMFTYQLDDGSIRENGNFTNLATGGHTITITNLVGCSSPLVVPINIIGFPKFFTPNNDGFNDRWNIVDSFSELAENMVKIYDRYGKMVANIRTSKDGWDGTYNGKMLRSDDYWFEVELTDGRIYRNHFSLIR